jgi:hypothetical protein
MAGGVRRSIASRVLSKISKSKERIRIVNSFDKSVDFLVAWDEAQTDKDQKYIQDFLKFLHDSGKKVECVIYHHTRKKEKIKAFPKDGNIHLSKFDFSTLGLPKTVQVKKLLATKFDFFINLNQDGRFPLKSIAGLTNATCRIGFPLEKSLPFYDILIGNPANDTMEEFIKDLKFYVRKIG